MNTITDLIKGAIDNTAKLRDDSSITSARDMIPPMLESEYPPNHILDISYMDKSSTKFDIFYPDNTDGPYPVFIEVHGGAWYFGQKSSIEFRPFLYGLSRGFACISAEYSLCPEVSYPEPVVEIKELIKYIKLNAQTLNIDPSKIILWGGSAGAQLAALAALSSNTGYLENPSSNDVDSSVNGLILWYGCYDCYLPTTLDNWVYENYFGVTDLSTIPEQLILSNPASHITQMAPPILLQHGLEDVVVPYKEAICFYERLKCRLGEEKCILELLEDCNHADIKMFAENNIKRIFDFAVKCIT